MRDRLINEVLDNGLSTRDLERRIAEYPTEKKPSECTVRTTESEATAKVDETEGTTHTIEDDAPSSNNPSSATDDVSFAQDVGSSCRNVKAAGEGFVSQVRRHVRLLENPPKTKSEQEQRRMRADLSELVKQCSTECAGLIRELEQSAKSSSTVGRDSGGAK